MILTFFSSYRVRWGLRSDFFHVLPNPNYVSQQIGTYENQISSNNPDSKEIFKHVKQDHFCF